VGKKGKDKGRWSVGIKLCWLLNNQTFSSKSRLSGPLCLMTPSRILRHPMEE
jgi:hypothetical protein